MHGVSGGKPGGLRARRRRARFITLFTLTVFLALGVWGVGLLSYHSRLTIAEIQVEGAKDTPTSAISDAFNTALHDHAYHLFSRANIFLYPRTMLSGALLNDFPRLDSVSISRASLLSQAIIVTVHERDAQYEWCNDGGCYLVDASGYLFAPTVGASDRYVFRGGLFPGEPIGQTFLQGRLRSVTQLLDVLSRAGFSPRGATVESEKDLEVELQKGFALKFAFDADFHAAARKFALAAASEALARRLGDLEYIDLRFGDRLYYKFKGGEEIGG